MIENIAGDDARMAWIDEANDHVSWVGPMGSNHGSLARARARGAGSPWTAQSLLLALGRLPDPEDEYDLFRLGWRYNGAKLSFY